MLTGACMGRSGFNRKTALATVTMVLAAEVADLDVLWEFRGSIAGLQHHRGITHSFVGVPFVAATVLGTKADLLVLVDIFINCTSLLGSRPIRTLFYIGFKLSGA